MSSVLNPILSIVAACVQGDLGQPSRGVILGEIVSDLVDRSDRLLMLDIGVVRSALDHLLAPFTGGVTPTQTGMTPLQALLAELWPSVPRPPPDWWSATLRLVRALEMEAALMATVLYHWASVTHGDQRHVCIVFQTLGRAPECVASTERASLVLLLRVSGRGNVDQQLPECVQLVHETTSIDEKARSLWDRPKHWQLTAIDAFIWQTAQAHDNAKPLRACLLA